ncbi:MAG: VWA domain-containing protein [Nanoarchaeota archaeon]
MMISFANPYYLWFLVSIPFFIFSHFALLKYNRYKALKFANFEAIRRVTGKRLLTKNMTILFLRIFVLLFLVLAITKPIVRYQGKASGYDYVIAIDASASMVAEDFLPNRLEVAKQSADAFITQLKGRVSIGVVKFSGVTFIEEPLTEDKLRVRSSIAGIEIIKVGGTDLAGAVITSTNLLLNSNKSKAIILLTDGSNTAGTFIEDAIQTAIDYAVRKNVKVFSIGIGSESGPIGYLPEYYNISATYNQDALFRISNSTGAIYYYALDYADITRAYDQIMEENQNANLELDLTYPALVVALILLFVEWVLINTRFRRFP